MKEKKFYWEAKSSDHQTFTRGIVEEDSMDNAIKNSHAWIENNFIAHGYVDFFENKDDPWPFRRDLYKDFNWSTYKFPEDYFR